MAAAVEEAGLPTTGIHALTDSHLGHIFGLVRRPQRRWLPRVCRRWRSVFYSEPLLWQHICLSIPSLSNLTAEQQQGWFKVQLRQLSQVGAFVAAATVLVAQASSCNPEQAIQCGCLLQLLMCGQLRSLELHAARSLDALGAAASLRRCSSLTSLSLTSGSPHDQLTEAVPLLTHLQRLSLHAVSPLLPIAAGLARLTRLSELRLRGPLSCKEREQHEASNRLDSLRELHHLKHLELVDTSGAGALLRPPPPAAFAALEAFAFSCPQGCVELEGVVMHSCCFHAAEETDLVASEAPAGHSYGDGDEGAALSAAQHVLEVVRARVTHAPLAPLLAALLPRGAALRSLELYFCWLDEDWCAGCVCLEATTSLKLSSCSTRSAAALVRAAPALRRLTLLGALPESGAMPRFVTALRGITALSFRANNLRHLPPGPYLAELVHLDLAGNDFSRLPPALSAASCLRRLSLECNERLELSAADAEVLLALPALTSLRLGPPERQEGLEAQAALLALRNHIPEVRVV